MQESGSFEKARKGEVIGLNTLAAHVRKMYQGRGKMSILDGAGDESSPCDDGTRRSRGE